MLYYTTILCIVSVMCSCIGVQYLFFYLRILKIYENYTIQVSSLPELAVYFRSWDIAETEQLLQGLQDRDHKRVQTEKALQMEQEDKYVHTLMHGSFREEIC